MNKELSLLLLLISAGLLAAGPVFGAGGGAGLSNGPPEHLCYRFLSVNRLSLKLPVGQNFVGGDKTMSLLAAASEAPVYGT